MTIEEAINHQKEVAKINRIRTKYNALHNNDKGEINACLQCAEKHEQLAEWLEELQQYRAIGTVEECREAREGQIPKKPVKDEYNHDCCPNCGWVVYQDEWGGRYLPHCENCGQAISWESDTP